MSWKNVGRVGVDTAGGVIIGPGVPTVIVNSSPITIETDSVTPHGSNPPHSSSPKLTPGGGDPVVLAGPATKQVFRKGDLATCGHPLTPGSPNVFAGTGAAAAMQYMAYVESNFNRPPGTAPAASLSDVYGLAIDDDEFPDRSNAYGPGYQLTPEQEDVLDMYNSNATVEEDKTEPEPPPEDVPPNCAGLPTKVPGTPFSPSIQLSPNFTYGQLSTQVAVIAHTIPDLTKGGYTPNEQLCNLKNLADNVLEPLVARYGRRNIIINSGYRNNGKISQHEWGMAVDIRFRDLPQGQNAASYKAYYERAQEIRAGFNYDQLLLEYFGVNGAWIHVSYNSAGNRRQVITYFSEGSKKSGLWLKA